MEFEVIPEEPSVSEVIADQIYLGNLSAALDESQREKLGITRILSVCPDYPSTGPHHFCIQIDDFEYEDILIHLPAACDFIQRAVDQKEKILVHCVMGVSRSATVVAAYLMKCRNLDVDAALDYLKAKRRQIHPNYGFIKQLHAFADCKFLPTKVHPAYRSWKRRHKQDVTRYLNFVGDVAVVVRRVMITSDFPQDPQQAKSLLADLGITHLLHLTPSAKIPTPSLVIRECSINCSQSSEALIDSLKEACAFISQTLKDQGRVLIFATNEKEGCLVACAYVLACSQSCVSETLSTLNKALPLFSPTESFQRQLAYMAACRDKLLPAEPVDEARDDHAKEDKAICDNFSLQDLQDTLATIQEKARERPQAVMVSSPQLLSF